MKVKNTWKRPIRVGRQIIPKDGVVDVPEHLLLQPRVQKLRKTGKLVFPFHENRGMADKSTLVPAVLNKEPVEAPPDEPMVVDYVTEDESPKAE